MRLIMNADGVNGILHIDGRSVRVVLNQDSLSIETQADSFELRTYGGQFSGRVAGTTRITASLSLDIIGSFQQSVRPESAPASRPIGIHTYREPSYSMMTTGPLTEQFIDTERELLNSFTPPAPANPTEPEDFQSTRKITLED